MYTHKSLKLAILALFITTLVIFSGCTDTDPPINFPPIILSLTANPPSPIEVSQSTFITCLAHDLNEDTLYYSWTGTGGTITGSGSTITWTAPAIAGTYTITCTVSDGNLSDVQSIDIEVLEPEPVYRAFLVGIGDYQYFPDEHGNIDLASPPFNIDTMSDTLSHSGSGFYLINELRDLQATKGAILNGIANAFSGAGVNDVSYFYFNGHGIYSGGVSYLCPTEGSYYSPLSSYISTNELESALSAIPGTKVVFLDTCHSGGFIGKGKGEITISKEELESFNDEIINVFSQAQSKGPLTTNQYKVLTSCLSSQTCVELIPYEGDPWGLFTQVLCEGCGYDSYTHPYPADENENGEVTLHEAYTFTDEMVTALATGWNDLYGWDIDQDTQVHPLYSDFIIIEE